MFQNYFEESILGRAKKKGLISIDLFNIRDYSTQKHHQTEDTPYGGGAGMLMTCQPLEASIKEAKKNNSGPVIFFTPQGKTLTHTRAKKIFNNHKQAILVCGRYEGIDQRIRDSLVDQEFSIGNYVLTGGELPAMVFIDAVSRFIPNVVGDPDSVKEDSFSRELKGKKEYPHYTKPSDFKGLKVPDILLSGNHAEIKKWRMGKLK